MSKFTDAFNRTMTSEGIYSNHPNDPGQETFLGISRRYFPKWVGWDFVDAIRQDGKNPTDVDVIPRLREMAMDHYERVFWKPMGGTRYKNQLVAQKVFDMSVNIGHRSAARYLQESLNDLNRNGILWPDILEDGEIGPITIGTVNVCDEHDRSKYLIVYMVGRQIMHYSDLLGKNPRLEEFAAGWARRALTCLAEAQAEGLD